MKNKSLAMAVIFSLLTCLGPLAAKERQGVKVKILKKDGKALKGELIIVKPTSLLLLDSQTGADVSVDIEEINAITVGKKSKALPGLLIGLGAGFLVGGVITNSGQQEEHFMFSKQEERAMVIWVFSVLGGLVAGAALGADQTFQPAVMSEKDTKALFEKLRLQARITDFQ